MAGSSTIYDDIKDTLFEVIMDKLWYQSNGMLYYAETLYSFTQLMVEYPLRGLITKYLNSCLTQPQHKNQALHGHLESTTPMLEDISNQDLILQRSLFTIWTIGFLIHLVQVYYNLDYWTHHSLGSELFQPSKNL